MFYGATGGVGPLNVGLVYTTLDRLERDGLVTMTEDDDQKSYEITAAGRDELGSWWHAVPLEDPPPRDELMLKTLMAIEHGADHALAVVTRHRTALQALLQQRRRERRPSSTGAVVGGEELASLLVTDALIVRAEADLRWLDLCESRIVALHGAESSTHRKDGR
jgi:DNA-binding PadR family transcriptional regulator